MNATPDNEITRRYRDASGELGETPSAAARAAILAAAARQVQARPEDASNIAKRPRAFARWPLGAAAAVLLSTLAVLMADRTEREIGSELASSRADSATEARSEVAKPASSAPQPAPAQEAKAKQGNATDAEAQTPARRADARELESRRVDPPAAAPPPMRQETPAAPAAVARPVTPTPPSPATSTPAASADAAAARSMAESTVREQDRGLSSSSPAAPSAAMGQLRKNERERATTAPASSAESPAAAAPTMSGAAARLEGKVEMTAAAWLERIIELRRKGEDERADAELKKFRERYPEVVIPPQAQPAIGTR